MSMTLPPGSEVEPYEDSLFCRMYQETGQTTGRIIIPDAARKRVFFAHVLKVGPGKTIDVDKEGEPIRMPMKVEKGDDVLFMRYHGEEIEIDGEYYLTMKDADVLAKIKMAKPAPNDFFIFAKDGAYDDEDLRNAKAS